MCDNTVTSLHIAVLLQAFESVCIHSVHKVLITRYVSPPTPRTMMNTLRDAPGFVEMCEAFGYEAHEHIVQTKDGYLLGLHRICRTRSETTAARKRPRSCGIRPKLLNKPVIYMHHGLMMNSEVWVCNLEQERQLPFVLVEQGYDVWFGNNRGNKYSKKHITMNSSEVNFWNFCLDDFALRDIPDSIDYILSATQAKTTSYIGFSQGTAQAFATLSINPRLNEVVNLFIALAPAMSPRGLHNPLVDGLIKSSPAALFLFFGRKAILPSTIFWQSIMYPPLYVRLLDVCMKILFNWHSNNISFHQKMASYYHLYSFASVKSLVHWFQIIRSGCFQMYDDSAYNVYGNFYKVARFPTRNISAPIVLYYGGSDSLVEIDAMLAELPRHAIVEVVPHYEHLDFLWANDVDKEVYPGILNYLRQYDGTIDSRHVAQTEPPMCPKFPHKPRQAPRSRHIAMSLIEENLQLEELDTDLYRSAKALWRPKGARGIFGGAVIAQALSAAMKTVQEGFSIHSLHSYFVLRGDELHPVLYHVERVRDGKSYATRTVQARQKNRAIFTLTCSFQKSETSSLQHQTIMPNNIPDPEDLPSDEDILLEDDSDGTGVKLPEYVRERLKNNIEVGPTDQRRIPLDYTGIPEHKRRQMYWCKAKGTITGGWPAHAMAIAYFSDSWFLSTALSVNKKSPRHVAMMASLDHSIYFHTACEADQWLLYDMESPFSGFGRGFALGRIFTRDGVLVASTVQEGLIRMKADIPKL